MKQIKRNKSKVWRKTYGKPICRYWGSPPKTNGSTLKCEKPVITENDLRLKSLILKLVQANDK